MLDILKIIGRKDALFTNDLENYSKEIFSLVHNSRFLVLGGAGSIGQAVVKELFKRDPRILHVVDLSENNLAELVRDLRSSLGYTTGEFKTFALDINSTIFNSFLRSQKGYDYILNLSALKHVRSEKDEFTLMRMLEVNVFNTDQTLKQAIDLGCKKYFCVSTDKAANPVNLMGGSKRIMEKFLMYRSLSIPISTARFANVAFSDGSLLHGFNQRIQKRQPLVAPNDVKRYFVTPQESGELCLMSALFGENRDIFFPKLSNDFQLTSFTDIVLRYLEELGYEPHMCKDETEARSMINDLIPKRKWPVLFTSSDTTGEKDEEEFFMKNEMLDLMRFENFGIVKNDEEFDVQKLKNFEMTYKSWKEKGHWTKQEIIAAYRELIPELSYEDKGKYLDQKM
ncbi:MAG: UDP-N-acetylglucosamine 4,6-dehydratase [Bacteroidetes bacterium]|nr:UDP-N-acetylglucosamine 4,6-dehydratase [Bacteroidota bacterium]